MAPAGVARRLCGIAALGVAALRAASAAEVAVALADEAIASSLAVEDAAPCDGDVEQCAAELSLRQLRSGAHLGADGSEVAQPDVGDANPSADASAPDIQTSRLAMVKRALKQGNVTSLVSTLSSKSRVVTGYHQTSIGLCHAIVGSSFRPGRMGWCGGGIYFSSSRGGTFGEAVGPDSHQGCIIQARVDLGKTKRMGRHCDPSMNGKRLADMGYDSIGFDTGVGTGTQWVIYDPRRVLSMKIIWENSEWHGPAKKR